MDAQRTLTAGACSGAPAVQMRNPPTYPTTLQSSQNALKALKSSQKLDITAACRPYFRFEAAGASACRLEVQPRRLLFSLPLIYC